MSTRRFFLIGLGFLTVGVGSLVILVFLFTLPQSPPQTVPLSSSFSSCIDCGGPGGSNTIASIPSSQLTIAYEWPDQIDVNGSDTISIYFTIPSVSLSVPTAVNHEVRKTTPHFSVGAGNLALNDFLGTKYEVDTATAHLVTTAFNVQAVQPEEQTIKQPSIEWDWNISPKAVGIQVIDMDIEVRWKPTSKGGGNDILLQIWRDSVVVKVYQPFFDIRQISLVSLIGLLGGAGLTVPFIWSSIWERIDKRYDEKQKKGQMKQENVKEPNKSRERLQGLIQKRVERQGRKRGKRERPTPRGRTGDPDASGSTASQIHDEDPVATPKALPSLRRGVSRRTVIRLALGILTSVSLAALLSASERLRTSIPLGKLLYKLRFFSSFPPYYSGLAWSPKGNRLAFFSKTYTFVVDAENGGLVCSSEHPQNIAQMAWSPDGTRIVSTDLSDARVWDANTGNLLLTHPGAHVTWSPDGTRIASILIGTWPTYSNTIQVWDANTGRTFLDIRGLPQGDILGEYSSPQLDWSPDGTHIAVLDLEAGIHVLDAAQGTIIHFFENDQHTLVEGMAWSPDGTHIAAGFQDQVYVWEAVTGRLRLVLSGLIFLPDTIIWSPDGTRIAMPINVYNIARVEVWDALTGKRVRTYVGHKQYVTAVAWAPDGTRIASGSLDKTVHVWEARDSTQPYIYRGHSEGIIALGWAPDGMRIASGSADGAVHVWGAG